MREWWGLLEKDREIVRREMEKLEWLERIGGFVSERRKRFGEEGGEGR